MSQQHIVERPNGHRLSKTDPSRKGARAGPLSGSYACPTLNRAVVLQAREEEDFGDDTAPADEGEEGAAQAGSGLPWDGSDRDYTYDELLGEPFGSYQWAGET